MKRGEAGSKTLLKHNFFHELLFPDQPGKPQERHSNFTDINESSVTETFEKTALICESCPQDSNFIVTVFLKIQILQLHKNQKESRIKKINLRSTILQSNNKQQRGKVMTQHQTLDMLFLKRLHRKLSEQQKEARKIQIQQLLSNAMFTQHTCFKWTGFENRFENFIV